MNKTGNTQINTKDYWDKRYMDRMAYAEETGMARFNRAMFEILDGDYVLDIGCGIGTFTELVKKTYPMCRVMGMDISEKAIQDNRDRNSEIGYVVGAVGTATYLPKDRYDVIFSGEVLEHLDDPHALFKEAYVQLKKGGKFIVTTPNEGNIRSPEHMHEFTREDVKLLFEVNGFRGVQDIKLPNGEDQLVIMQIGYK